MKISVIDPKVVAEQALKPSISSRNAVVEKLNAMMNASTPTPNQPMRSVEDLGSVSTHRTAPTEQAPQIDQVKEEQKAPNDSAEVKDRPLSSEYAKLAQRDRAIRFKANELKQQELSLKAKEAEMVKAYEAKLIEAEKVFKQRLASDPFGMLNETGLTYDQLTEAALRNPGKSPEEINIAKLREEIKAEMRAEIESTRKSIDESISRKEQEGIDTAVKQMTQDMRDLAREDGSYEAIRATKSEGLVAELIKRAYLQDGVTIPLERAARMIEDELTNKIYKQANSINKIKSKLQPAPSASGPDAAIQKQQDLNKPAGQQPQPALKTLTNAIGTSRPQTARERAIARFKGDSF